MFRHFLAPVFVAACAGCSEYSQPLAMQPTPDRAGAQSATLQQLAPKGPAVTLTQNDVYPTSMLVHVPCAADGAGELVDVEGPLHVLSHITSTAGGGFHVKQHYQPQGVIGIGRVTGEKYQGTGVTQWEFEAGAGMVSTYINNFRLTGRGRASNFVVHEVFHTTLNANGRLTSDVVDYSTECR